MLLDVSDSPAQHDSRLSPNILVTDSDFSTQRLDQSVEAAQQRRFAGSALADERDSATSRNIDAHIVQRCDGSEAVRDIPGGEERRHALKTDYGRDSAPCLPSALTITR